jgi:hypothetical protein
MLAKAKEAYLFSHRVRGFETMNRNRITKRSKENRRLANKKRAPLWPRTHCCPTNSKERKKFRRHLTALIKRAKAIDASRIMRPPDWALQVALDDCVCLDLPELPAFLYLRAWELIEH